MAAKAFWVSLASNENLMTPSLILTTWLLASPRRPGIPAGGIIKPLEVPPQQLALAPPRPTEELTVEQLEESGEQTERLLREISERMAFTKPLDVKAQRVGSNSVSITWKPTVVTQIDGEPIIGYEVKREEKGNLYTRKSIGTTTNLSLLDNTAVRGKSYVYLVRAITKKSFGLLSPAAPVQIP